MKKYLLNNYGYEHNHFYGFESELSEDELNKQLQDIMDKTRAYCYFTFYGKSLIKCSTEDSKVISLDNFWKESLKRK